MTQFEYVMNISKVDSHKTLKAAEEFIRELNDLSLPSVSHYGATPSPADIEATRVFYKLFTYAIKKHTRELPLFIHDKVRSLSNTLTSIYFNPQNSRRPLLPSHDIYIDTFQYVDVVQFDYDRGELIKNLDITIGSNMQPYSLSFRINVPSEYHYQGPNRELLYLEDLRQQFPPEEAHTVLDLAIEGQYKRTAPDMEKLQESIDHLESITKAMYIIQSKFSAKLLAVPEEV